MKNNMFFLLIQEHHGMEMVGVGKKGVKERKRQEKTTHQLLLLSLKHSPYSIGVILTLSHQTLNTLTHYICIEASGP